MIRSSYWVEWHYKPMLIWSQVEKMVNRQCEVMAMLTKSKMARMLLDRELLNN